jgi:hypothetical protein
MSTILLIIGYWGIIGGIIAIIDTLFISEDKRKYYNSIKKTFIVIGPCGLPGLFISRALYRLTEK